MSELQDTGWADAKGARAAVAAAKKLIREAAGQESSEHFDSVVRRRAQLLIELIDKRLDGRDVRQPVLALGKLKHAVQNVRELIARAWGKPLQQPDHSEDHRAADLVIMGELALAIFDHRHPLFQRGLHKTSGLSAGDHEPDATGTDSHRISGDAQ